jgi:hypothetical protein
VSTWPFEAPPNTAAITLRSIAFHGAPILLVTHDQEDGQWQFLDGSDAPDPQDACIIALSNVLALDPSIQQIADLPEGWIAHREHAGSTWQRAKR